MKTLKRVSAILMACIMMATACCLFAFAADRQTPIDSHYKTIEDASELGYETYFCFADSIGTGYLAEQSDVDMKYVNLANVRRDGETTTIAYPTMIANALDINVKQNRFGFLGTGNTEKDPHWNVSPDYDNKFMNYARDGYTTHEFRRLLDESYYNQMTEEEKTIQMDTILDGDFTKNGYAGFKQMQSIVHTDLANADVITIGIGSNDLLFYPLQNTLAVVNDQSINAAVHSALASFGMEAALGALVDTAVTVGKLPIVLYTLVQQSNQANAAFAENWDAILKIINEEKKPTAKIYCSNIYNSNKKLKFSSTSQLRIGELVGLASQQVNQVITSTSAYRNTYTVVDVKGVEDLLPEWEPLDQWQSALNEGYFYTMFMVCAHPRQNGQEYIANQFLSAMKENALG